MLPAIEKPSREKGPDAIREATAPPETVDASADAPPSRAEFDLLAAQVRQLAAQIAHGRA